MKRGEKSLTRVDAILTSDWHLREDTPKCRTDDFLKALILKMKFVSDLQRKYNCPVLHGGDLFHYWKSSPFLISLALENLPNDFWSAIGQHDLPQHVMSLIHKSAFHTVVKAERVHFMQEWGHWGKDPEDAGYWKDSERKVTVLHRMVWKDRPPFPGCVDMCAKDVLRAYPEYDLILTGDNHTPFVERLNGRILVNPGSLMRTTADQMDHRPRVYLWDSEVNEVSPVYLPINPGVVTRDHLDHQEERDARIQAFVERLTMEDWNSELSFEVNLERFASENEIPDYIMAIILRAIEEG